MKKAIISTALFVLVGSFASAATLGKMALICLGTENKDLIRSVYTSIEGAPQKLVYIADPVGFLVTADRVDRPSNEMITIQSSNPTSQELLTIKTDGSGTLEVTTQGGGSNQYSLKCYAKGSSLGSGLFSALGH